MIGVRIIRAKDESILSKIYNDVYLKVNSQYIDVFLCGGASYKGYNSTRDLVRTKIEKMKNIRVLYPEDLFIEILNLDKDSDLLSLEQFLADNCDVICIIAESPGSFVELGAFVNSDKTIDKVIGVIESKRRKDKSFIMQGPIKLLNKKDKNQVVYYDKNDIDGLANKLKTVFTKRKKVNRKHSNIGKTINSIVGLYNFMPLLLYFYTKIEVSEMKDCVSYIFDEFGFNKKHFDTMYMSGLKLLYKDKYIIKKNEHEKSVYCLTDRGYRFANKILQEMKIADKTKLHDSIRFDIMNEKYYRKPRTS